MGVGGVSAEAIELARLPSRPTTPHKRPDSPLKEAPSPADSISDIRQPVPEFLFPKADTLGKPKPTPWAELRTALPQVYDRFEETGTGICATFEKYSAQSLKPEEREQLKEEISGTLERVAKGRPDPIMQGLMCVDKLRTLYQNHKARGDTSAEYLTALHRKIRGEQYIVALPVIKQLICQLQAKEDVGELATIYEKLRLQLMNMRNDFRRQYANHITTKLPPDEKVKLESKIASMRNNVSHITDDNLRSLAFIDELEKSHSQLKKKDGDSKDYWYALKLKLLSEENGAGAHIISNAMNALGP